MKRYKTKFDKENINSITFVEIPKDELMFCMPESFDLVVTSDDGNTKARLNAESVQNLMAIHGMSKEEIATHLKDLMELQLEMDKKKHIV